MFEDGRSVFEGDRSAFENTSHWGRFQTKEKHRSNIQTPFKHTTVQPLRRDIKIMAVQHMRFFKNIRFRTLSPPTPNSPDPPPKRVRERGPQHAEIKTMDIQKNQRFEKLIFRHLRSFQVLFF